MFCPKLNELKINPLEHGQQTVVKCFLQQIYSREAKRSRIKSQMLRELLE